MKKEIRIELVVGCPREGEEDAVLQTQTLGTTQMIQYVLTHNFNYERSVWVIMPVPKLVEVNHY